MFGNQRKIILIGPETDRHDWNTNHFVEKLSQNCHAKSIDWVSEFRDKQWCRQALKSGWAQGVWRRKSPSGVQGPSPDGGLGVKPPEDRYIKQFASVKCFSTQVCCRVRSPSPPLPPSTPKKTSDLRESHDLTRPGQGGHVPTRGYATGDK